MYKLILAIILAIGLAGSANSARAAIPAEVLNAATTQPANAESAPAPEKNADKNAPTAAEIFGNTRVGKLFQGKQRLTIEDVRNPEFWVDTVRDLIFAVITFIPRLIIALLFLVFFWMVYRALRRLVLGSMNKAHVDESIRDMLALMMKWSIMGFGLVVACNQIGIQIAALLTAAGVIGLAVGFAAQETLANFIAGIVIFWDKPFRPGDWVEIENTYGQVKRVTFRSVRILDFNGQMIIYPNSFVLSHRVSNHSTHPLTRVCVPIGVAYKESIDAARATLLTTTGGDERVAKDPPPFISVVACGDSSVNLILRFWILDESQEKTIEWEYIERCKKALDAAGIQIPFPHMQLLLEESPAIHSLVGNAMRKAG